MGLPVTYVSSTSFYLSGEFDYEFPEGRTLEANQGADGATRVAVSSASYDAETDRTTVVVKDTVLTSNLVSIKRGPGDKTSLGKHYHNDELTDAGLIPAAQLNSQQVSALLAAATLPDPTHADNGLVVTVHNGAYVLMTV